MEGKMRIEIEIPMERVLKEREKNELSKNFVDGLKEKGITEVAPLDAYYVEKRSAVQPLGYLVLTYLGGVADIVTIIMAIWTVLKEKEAEKQVTVKIGNEVYVRIKGKMPQEEILQLVREAKKPIGKRKG